MIANTISTTEAKNKKKGMRISFVFHAILVLLALLPFLTPSEQEPNPQQQEFVTVDFTEFESSEGKSGAPKASDKNERTQKSAEVVTPQPEETEAVPEPTPETEEIPEPEPEVIPEPTPEPEVKPEPVPERDPVMTTPDPTPPIRTAPTKKAEPKKTERKRTRKVVIKERKPYKPRTKPKKRNTGTKEGPNRDGAEKKGEANSDKSSSGEKAENGSRGDKESKDTGTGKSTKGDKYGDFPGDGLFNRRVVHRADVKNLTNENGKIVINLCVNQTGRVTFVEYNKGKSTISTKALVQKAEAVTKQYRFDTDYTAPKKQCGQMTYIFEIEEE